MQEAELIKSSASCLSKKFLDFLKIINPYIFLPILALFSKIICTFVGQLKT